MRLSRSSFTSRSVAFFFFLAMVSSGFQSLPPTVWSRMRDLIARAAPSDSEIRQPPECLPEAWWTATLGWLLCFLAPGTSVSSSRFPFQLQPRRT